MKNYVRVLRKKKSHKDFFGWNPTLAKRVDKLEEAWLDPDTGEVFLESPAEPEVPEVSEEAVERHAPRATPEKPKARPTASRASSKPRKARAQRKKPASTSIPQDWP